MAIEVLNIRRESRGEISVLAFNGDSEGLGVCLSEQGTSVLGVSSVSMFLDREAVTQLRDFMVMICPPVDGPPAIDEIGQPEPQVTRGEWRALTVIISIMSAWVAADVFLFAWHALR